LYRHDDWLRDHVPRRPLDLAAVGRRLLGYGITGVTDLTPTSATADLDTLAAAAADLAVHVTVTGSHVLPAGAQRELPRGPVKVVVDDHELASIEAIVEQFRVARTRGRPVAVHCVTRVALVLALAAWHDVGAVDGDRIEHGAVIPVELVGEIRDLGLLVVTQPNFVRARGDQYLADVDPDDRAHLWRCGSLLEAGIEVAFGSDAPYGDPDPWALLASAVDRRTRNGIVLGPGERIGAGDALDRMLGEASDPASTRRVEAGAAADLCLLDRPLSDQLAAPTTAAVRATLIAGRPYDAAELRVRRR
jgi:predicted amidohydrolase YtcJ